MRPRNRRSRRCTSAWGSSSLKIHRVGKSTRAQRRPRKHRVVDKSGNARETGSTCGPHSSPCSRLRAAVAALATGLGSHNTPAASAAGACQLGNKAGQIKHVIYLQFDNTHFRRDRAERPVRSRADAAPAELPQGERHARHERPHDPDLTHRRRHPLVADRPVSRPAGPDGLEQLRLLRGRRHTEVHVVVQVLDGHRGRDERIAPEHGRRRRTDDARSVAHLHRGRLQRRRRGGGEHRAREQLDRPRPAT